MVEPSGSAIAEGPGELSSLRARLREAEETLEAIRSGSVDALIVHAEDGERVFTLEGADHSFRVLVEHMNEGALTLDEHGTVLYANARLAEMLDAPLERVFGSSLHDWFDPGTHEALTSALASARSCVLDLKLRRASGASLPVLCSASDLSGLAPKTQIGIVLTDLSDRYRAEELMRLKEAAEEADKLKSAFLAMMSHELRTPLNVVLGFAGILERGLPGELNAEQQRQVQMIRRSGERLRDLITDVLDISKIEAGELSLEAVVFDFADAVEAARLLLAEQANVKGLDFEVEVGPGLEAFVGDRVRVEQILINLTGNAIKFTDTGSVRVSVRRIGDRAEIEVCDTGIGIPTEHLPRLFEPFTQAHRGIGGRRQGSGLGLSICRRLTDLMGGSISVSTEAGAGTTFEVQLPLSPPANTGGP